MVSPADGTEVAEGGIERTERSLRRALAVTDDADARYHVRTALQELVLVRETVEADESPDDLLANAD